MVLYCNLLKTVRKAAAFYRNTTAAKKGTIYCRATYLKDNYFFTRHLFKAHFMLVKKYYF